MLDEPISRPYSLSQQLPGRIYNVNKQCELIFGPGTQVCPYMVSGVGVRISTVTLQLWVSEGKLLCHDHVLQRFPAEFETFKVTYCIEQYTVLISDLLF